MDTFFLVVPFDLGSAGLLILQGSTGRSPEPPGSALFRKARLQKASPTFPLDIPWVLIQFPF